jgi:hypothetical protein
MIRRLIDRLLGKQAPGAVAPEPTPVVVAEPGLGKPVELPPAEPGIGDLAPAPSARLRAGTARHKSSVNRALGAAGIIKVRVGNLDTQVSRCFHVSRKENKNG